MLTTHSYASMLRCMLIISEHKDICNHLHVVIFYEVSYDPLGSIDPRIDLTWLCSDQGQWFHLDKPVIDHILGVHGTLHFYHKSFYDFIRDPTRSSVFCINTPAFYCMFLDHMSPSPPHITDRPLTDFIETDPQTSTQHESH